MAQIKNLKFLFSAISSSFPAILTASKDSSSQVIKFSYEKYVGRYKTFIESIPVAKARGFHICSLFKDITFNGSLGYHCKNEGMILFIYLCDGIFDCPNDQSDEESCSCDLFYPLIKKDHILCKKIFVYGQQIDRVDQTERHSMQFQCESNKHNISSDMKNDLICDCGQQCEDEPLLVDLLKYANETHCPKASQIPCKEGHSKCYEVYLICKYRIDSNGNLSPCRNGGHLENCLQFDCGIEFKCHMAYCILWSNVCDGKWDCPYREDETYEPVCGVKVRCSNMFKCRHNKYKCIHLNDICDGKYDCPQKDDELYCDLKYVECPESCKCTGYTMICSIHTLIDIRKMVPYNLVIIIDSKINFLNLIGQYYENMKFLNVIKCNIRLLCDISFPAKLLSLDLSFNKIDKTEQHCFQSYTTIQKIILDFNQIQIIQSESFKNLPKLAMVSFSNNPLNVLQKRIFINCPSLKLLSFLNINLFNIHENTFSNLYNVLVRTNEFHVCCAAHFLSCSAKIPWYISCTSILHLSVMRSMFIGISSVVLILNTISIFSCILGITQNKKLSLMVISINLTDTLCTAYLCIIWIADLSYQGIFQVKEELWRSSVPCFSAFFIILYFTLLSTLILTLMALSRLMLVWYPVDKKFKDHNFVLKSILFLVILSLIICLSFTIILKIHFRILPTSLCLPFIDPLKSVFMIKIIVWSSILTQSMLSIVIVTVYILLALSLYTKKDNDLNQKSTHISYKSLILQLILITVSNILCWFSTNGIYTMTMILTEYPTQLVIWSTVILMPINSIVNPTISVLCHSKII